MFHGRSACAIVACMAPDNENGRSWIEADIRKMITNPVYAGLAPYPAIVPDAEWIAAASKLIEQRGAASFLREMLANLREAFPPPADS